jgi:serine/threonine protein kinase
MKNNQKCEPPFELLQKRRNSIFVTDLIKKMMEKNPDDRITAEEALNHPFFFEMDSTPSAKSDCSQLNYSQECIKSPGGPFKQTSSAMTNLHM